VGPENVEQRLAANDRPISMSPASECGWIFLRLSPTLLSDGTCAVDAPSFCASASEGTAAGRTLLSPHTSGWTREVECFPERGVSREERNPPMALKALSAACAWSIPPTKPCGIPSAALEALGEHHSKPSGPMPTNEKPSKRRLFPRRYLRGEASL
jgi:hypothetical protein